MKLNIVPARTGLLWLKLGIQTFYRQPLALAGLFFMYMATMIAVSQIPVLGIVIGTLLVPAATLGLMAATAEATKGRFPMPSVLISAFRAGRQRMRAMLALGGIYTIGSTLATLLASFIVGDEANDLSEINKITLLAFALHTPLFMMFWHAPALVHWHGVTPAKSLFFSAVACLRNFGALALYGVTWMVLFIAVCMVVGLLGELIGGANMARAAILPTALLMASMFSTSMYFTFRDSFVAPADPELPPPATPS
jgi:hypothetical protein